MKKLFKNKHTIKFSMMITLIPLLTLSSCSSVPEGPIKDFVDNFNFEKTYEAIDNGIIEINEQSLQDDEVVGTLYSYTEFSKKDDIFYYYNKIEYTGNLIDSETKIESYETLKYVIDEETCYSVTITNGEREVESNLKPINIQDYVTLMFYDEKSYDYYRGGFYYGDVIYINIDTYYPYFTLEDNDSLLRYTIVDDVTYEGAIFNTNFAVDKLGMLIDYHYDGKMFETGVGIINEIECSYNQNFELKESI